MNKSQEKAVYLIRDCADAYAHTHCYEVIKFDVVPVGYSLSVAIWFSLEGSKCLHKSTHLFVGPHGRISYPTGTRKGLQTYRRFDTMDEAVKRVEKYHASMERNLARKRRREPHVLA